MAAAELARLPRQSAKLTIRHPLVCRAEVAYTTEIVFGDWLGVDFELVFESRDDVLITADGQGELHMPCWFFNQAEKAWLALATLPQAMRLVPDPIDGTAGHEFPLVEFLTVGDLDPMMRRAERVLDRGAEGDHSQVLRCDVLGTTFVWLSRYEEVVLADRDEHDRFPASASFSGRHGLLLIPVVDRHVSLLARVMERLWPGLTDKAPAEGTVFTCDVDHPYTSWLLDYPSALKKLAGDLVKRRSIAEATRTCRALLALNSLANPYDPYDSFEWLFELCERTGTPAIFYFIAGHSGGDLDGRYRLETYRIRQLLRRVHEHGHMIGLHGSYHTFRDPSCLRGELNHLRSVCAEEGIEQNGWPNRQHFLRWDSGVTPRVLAEAGVSSDSTLAFADHAGFRCGTARDYPMFDLRHRCSLRVTQRPLIVMEVSVTAERYMGLGKTPAAADLMQRLCDCSLRESGAFTILWHNSELTTRADRDILSQVLAHTRMDDRAWVAGGTEGHAGGL
ncbi:MAG: polysaccharide deacetylase family protein [Limisphaerales bacterium]